MIQSDPDYLPQKGDQVDSSLPVNSDTDDILFKRGKKNKKSLDNANVQPFAIKPDNESSIIHDKAVYFNNITPYLKANKVSTYIPDNCFINQLIPNAVDILMTNYPLGAKRKPLSVAEKQARCRFKKTFELHMKEQQIIKLVN